MNSDLNLKAFIKQFLNKSDEIEAKYELLRKKYDPNDIGFSYGSGEFLNLTIESQPLDIELLNYLELLEHDHLFTINALMYAGRDLNKENLFSFDVLKSQLDDTAKSLFYNIKPKDPRGEYIRKGLELYEIEL